jgi:hypothetical protein
VVDEELFPGQLNDFDQLKAQPRIVGVSEHGADRRDGFQFVNDPGLADVARVQDVIYPR